MSLPAVSVVGLGKLGACMAACLAHKGFRVIGLDLEPEVVQAVNDGRAPVWEPGLQDLIGQVRERLTATLDYREAVLGSDVTFFVVPTPSGADGAFSLTLIVDAAREAAKVLKEKAGYHLFVVTSTVLPGSTGFAVSRALEEASGKRCGPDFGLCYNPEFIALGSVVRDFLNPDFLLIGESDARAGDLLERLLRQVCDNNPRVARMSFVNAELTKIAVNTFVTTKITFANMLGTLCDGLPGADVDVVTEALGLDARIGGRYLRAGLGYGGPCFPRDNRALASFARRLDEAAALAESTDAVNTAIGERLVERIRRHTTPDSRVAVLGLSYKPLSNVVAESQGLYLADAIARSGSPVVVYDPVAMSAARRVLGERVQYAETVAAAVAVADVVVVANPDPAFRALVSALPEDRATDVTVIDCWRFLRAELGARARVRYVAPGLGEDTVETRRRLARMWGGSEAEAEDGRPPRRPTGPRS